MATYQQNSGERWRAIIGRKGHPLISASFDTKSQAQVWASTIESEIGRGIYRDLTATKQISLAQAMLRYSSVYTDAKKGAKQERNRIGLWAKQPLA